MAGTLGGEGSDRRPEVLPTAAEITRAMAVVADHVRRTPTIEADGVELGVDASLVLKLEYLQHSGSFKARGATNAMASRTISEAGVVAASGGNHGVAVAWAARHFGHRAHIFVPTISAGAKVRRLRDYGAKVHQVGEVYADALAASEAFLAREGGTSIHAYDDPVVMAGAATCAVELEEQAGDLDALLVACGGGGLSGGCAAWLRSRVPVVACETSGTATYAKALQAGRPVDIAVSGEAADALGASRLGTWPWRAMSAANVASAVVSDQALAEARERLWDQWRILVEPSAAAPVAALLSGAWRPEPGTRVGVVLCGANTTWPRRQVASDSRAARKPE